MLEIIGSLNKHLGICYITSQKYLLYKPHVNIMLVSSILDIVFICLIIPLNAVISIVILKKKKLQTPSNLLLLNTVISDFFVGIVSVPLFTGNFFLAYRAEFNCKLYIASYALVHFFPMISFTTVIAITFDRYLAIIKPFFYMEQIAQETWKYVILLVCLWVFHVILITVLICISYVVLIIQYEAFLFFTAVLLNVYIHTKIYKTVKCTRHVVRRNAIICSTISHSKSILQQQQQQQQQQRYRENQQQNQQRQPRKTTRKNIVQSREAKISMLTFLMVGSILLCFLPNLLCGIVWMLGFRKDWLQTLNMFAFTSACIKSLINPLVFCYSLISIRREVKYLLGIKKKWRR